MKNYVKALRELPGEGTVWGLAMRERGNKTLYQGDYSPFRFIKNSFLYWRADPFLFDYQGDTYVFAELFNRIKGKGVIGVAKIKNGKCGRFKKCLDLPFHLSYPCVFERDHEVFLIPECAKSKKITVYRSVSFPYQWAEAYTLFEGAAVDTTPVPPTVCSRPYFFTTIKDDTHPANSCLYAIDGSGKPTLLTDSDYTVRCAGHFIVDEGCVLRPSQDCTDYYGQGLIFKKTVYSAKTGSFREDVYRYIHASDIKTDEKKNFSGVHTYNLSERYEIVDLCFSVGNSLPYLIKKVIKHFK